MTNNYNENVTERDLKKILKKANQSEEQLEIKKFILILLGVVIVVLGFYVFTKKVVNKTATNTKKQEVVFDYNKTIMGSLLNRPYDEYYALIYNAESPKANYYYSMFSSYKAKEGSIKIYTIDLSDSMNSKFYSKNQSNPSAKDLTDLKVSDLTLIKVKDKKINKFVENEDSIKAELGL